MDVIDRSGTTVEFSAIQVASCFEYENDLFMRVFEEPVADNDFINVVSLQTGTLYHMWPHNLVTPVNGTFMITGRGVQLDA